MNRVIVLPEHSRDATDVQQPSCPTCKTMMHSVITSGIFNVNGNSYIVTNINAWECPYCTQVIYSAKEAGMIERAILEYKEELKKC
jgi:YgiT-type zinc finger domain-containing protein